MFDIGTPELVIIVIAFALLFFGSKKISDFAHGLGRATGEFKKGKKEVETEINGMGADKVTIVETKPVEAPATPVGKKIS